MDTNSIKQLLHRYKTNELSEQDKQDWRLLIDTAEGRQLLQVLMEAELNQLPFPQSFDMTPWKPVLERILSTDLPQRTTTDHQPGTRRIYRMRKWIAAAAALLILSAGALYLWNQPTASDASPALVKTQDITPGKQGAVLTLADGQQLVLDSMNNGMVAIQSGTQVTLKNGQLQYSRVQTGSNQPVYNTMSTPRGRQFKITLPDGTDVWLNAASSIRYPVEFSNTERRVEVQGEAFFHVKTLKLPAADGVSATKVPFIVTIDNKLDVEVLGTQFNVNAYTNEKNISTTLTEGVVRVRSKEEPAQFIALIPGQQAIAAQTGAGPLTVQSADLPKVLAWKNGLFNFENVSLADAMKQLERWYDIDVEYEKDIPNIWFSGKINRDTNLQGLLKILERTGVQFRVEGRKLVVLQGN